MPLTVPCRLRRGSRGTSARTAPEHLVRDRLAVRDRKLADSSVEGNGFEPSVPRCPAHSAGAIIRRRVGSSSRRNRYIGVAEADDCPDDTAAPALMEYAEGLQPLLAGKAKKIADEFGAQIDVWWKKNASDVIRWGAGISTLAVGVALLRLVGVDTPVSTTPLRQSSQVKKSLALPSERQGSVQNGAEPAPFHVFFRYNRCL